MLHNFNVNIATSNTYADIIDFLDEHYKQMRHRAKQIEETDLPTQKNLNYLIKNLMNKTMFCNNVLFFCNN